MKSKDVIEAEFDWEDFENSNPVEDLEKALEDLRSQPDFYGKERAVEFIKSILPDNHPENLDVNIETIQ